MKKTVVSGMAPVYVWAADGTSPPRSLPVHVRGAWFWSGRDSSTGAPSKKPLNKSVTGVFFSRNKINLPKSARKMYDCDESGVYASAGEHVEGPQGAQGGTETHSCRPMCPNRPVVWTCSILGEGAHCYRKRPTLVETTRIEHPWPNIHHRYITWHYMLGLCALSDQCHRDCTLVQKSWLLSCWQYLTVVRTWPWMAFTRHV